MKLFKKLMAAVLVGAMALTMLVGCGSSVDKKEMIKMINDSYGGRSSLCSRKTMMRLKTRQSSSHS